MKKNVMVSLKVVLFALMIFLLVSCKPAEVVTYDVTFDAANGTTAVVVTVDENTAVTQPANPTKDGYTFDAWYLGDTAFDFATLITADITLTAHYVAITNTYYTVSFDSVGGAAIDSQSVMSGDEATAPTAPAKEGFVFENWLLNGDVYNFSDPVTGDLALYAKYSYVGIPDSPLFSGRVYNGDFDQLINDFSSGTLTSQIILNASVDSDQPYIRAAYSGEIGNNPDGALWKQAGSQNSASAAFQYLVIRMRGFEGASINDLSIGFRLDDNHEVLVVPFVDTFDPDLENNTLELDGNWHNYVISITDTLDGLTYVGKTGYTDVAAGGMLVGFHLMNTSVNGSGILEIQDAYYSKVPNPVFPYSGSDYNQNKDYWSGTCGQSIGSFVTIDPSGFYGEYLTENVNTANTHVVLTLRQATPGTIDYADLKIAPVFDDGSIGDPVAFSDLTTVPESLGSGWLNVPIAFSEIYTGTNVIAGYKLINDTTAGISIAKSFLTYYGEYEAVNYPLLDTANALIFDNFNRATIGATSDWTPDNPVALANGFDYIISYSGLQASTIGDGYMTLDSTGGDYVSYKVHSSSIYNLNEYHYMVLKYKLNDGATLDNLRMALLTFSDAAGPVVYANQWQAGLGLPSIPADWSSYPYIEGDWTYLIIDLTLTDGYSTDVAGFDLYYTGSSISIDDIFFANPVTNLDPSSELMWATFEGLALGSAQDKVSDNQWWANVYDSPTTIINDNDINQALQLDGTGYAQYHTGIKGTGRYLAFDLRVDTVGTIESFRVGPTGAPLWAKDGQLILASGIPMVVNPDGQWHHYVIDWVASGLALTDTIGFHASDGEIYSLDNLAWFSENPYFDDELVWGTWDGFTVGDANGQVGASQYWANNYGSATSFVDDNGNMLLKLDATAGYVQYHTGVMAKPQYIAFDITVETAGSLGINVGGTHKWNADLIGLDGNPIVLPDAGNTAHIVIDCALSGFPYSDEFGIEANDGAVYYVDNISFQWNNPEAGMYPMLSENFDVTPTNDGSTYWWGDWGLVTDGAINLVTADYATVRFGSPLIAGANYLQFDVKLATDNNADQFRLELGDGNIVTWATLVADGAVSAVGADFMTVTINLADYVTNLNGLQVLGFHINAGGVVIDNLVVSDDAYGHQMSLFTE